MNSTWIMGANGVLAVGVPYPAVSRKQTRIRMIVTSEMTKEQLNKGYTELCNAIQQSKLEAESFPN
jgi:7-keto-8-aminopelargonate synthetase-like enzyme